MMITKVNYVTKSKKPIDLLSQRSSRTTDTGVARLSNYESVTFMYQGTSSRLLSSLAESISRALVQRSTEI